MSWVLGELKKEAMVDCWDGGRGGEGVRDRGSGLGG
jgi:hypothetical protein